jgi:hypothetical protein
VINSVNYFFIPESPRWLVGKNRSEEAKVILNQLAEKNNKAPISDFNQIVNDKLVIDENHEVS